RAGGTLTIRHDGEIVGEMPAASLTEDAPKLFRPAGEPSWQEDLWSNTLSLLRPPDVADAVLRLLDDPSIGDARWAYEQFDHMLFTDTVIEPGHNASMSRIKGTSKGLAVSTDGNGRI